MEKDTSTNNVFYCQNVTRSTRCIFFIEQNLIWSVDLFDLENGIEIYRQSLIKKQTLDSNVTAGTAVPQWPQYRHFLILFSIPIVRCPISLHWKKRPSVYILMVVGTGILYKSEPFRSV